MFEENDTVATAMNLELQLQSSEQFAHELIWPVGHGNCELKEHAFQKNCHYEFELSYDPDGNPGQVKDPGNNTHAHGWRLVENDDGSATYEDLTGSGTPPSGCIISKFRPGTADSYGTDPNAWTTAMVGHPLHPFGISRLMFGADSTTVAHDGGNIEDPAYNNGEAFRGSIDFGKSWIEYDGVKYRLVKS